MAASFEIRRRWLGAACLAIAAVMLILGQTILKNRFAPLYFILYWVACTGFVALAMVFALLDFRAVRLRSRAEQKELVEKTLREMGRQRDAGQKDGKGAGGSEKRSVE
jgi:hypothetical protein